MLKVLVIGGAGYIGSSVCLCLKDSGHDVVVVDDFRTGKREFVREFETYEGDFGDIDLLRRVVADHPDIGCVVHMAASIVVPESMADPLGYYDNNVSKSIALYDFLAEAEIERIVFSSSGSMYDPGDSAFVNEQSPLRPKSPYSRTKLVNEFILRDCANANILSVLSLRYFNPVGADPQMRSGLPDANPTHLLGKLLEAANDGSDFHLTGVDWPTRDGSALRDYIHVWDLARAHVAAVDRFDTVICDSGSRFVPIDVGTGEGTTVREFVEAFLTVSGSSVKVVEASPRPGDVVGAATRSTAASRALGWKPKFSLEEGIRDSIRWVEERPSVLGY